MKNLIIITILASIFTINCASEVKNYTEETIDGVRYVNNLATKFGPDDTPIISLEFVQKFGMLESTDDNYMFHNPRDLTIDSKGNLWILDAGNFKVKKFGPDGKFITSFGSQGQGPQEFGDIFTFAFDENDVLYISDPFPSTMTSIDINANFIAKKQFVIAKKIDIEKMLPSGDFYGSIWQSGIPIPGLLYKFNPDGEIIQRIGKRKEFSDPSLFSFGNSRTTVIDKNNNIFFNCKTQNRIEKFNSAGELLMVVTRYFEYDETTRNEKKVKFPTMNIFGSGIQIDGKDRIWSKIWDKETKTSDEKIKNIYKFEIFDENGVLIMHLPFDELYKIGRDTVEYKIFGDRLFILDASRTMIVKEYRIIG